MKEGDTIKDVIAYLGCRIDHLVLERNKVPFTLPKKDMQKAMDKLSAKIEELCHVKSVMLGNIKESSKHEWRKVQHLEKMKVAHLKGEDADE